LPTTRGLVEMGELSRMYGPLTRVPESERLPYQPPEDYAPVGAAYRDADWDHWYRREDGRWALNRLLHEQFEEVDRLYGPLTRAQDADVVSAAARHPKEGGTPPRWGVRGEALTEAAEVVKTSATIASSDDLIRLAEWLMGADQCPPLGCCTATRARPRLSPPAPGPGPWSRTGSTARGAARTGFW